MSNSSFALFATAIGNCAIVWSGTAIVSLLLPESTTDRMRARIARQFEGAAEAAPSPTVAHVMQRIARMLEGHVTDLSNIELDMRHVPAFHRRVYEAAREIPFGTTLSYGELAARIGSKGAARAVGQALGRNPYALIVPCHRVLAKSGKLTGFSAYGGIATKRRLLQLEGCAINTRRSAR